MIMVSVASGIQCSSISKVPSENKFSNDQNKQIDSVRSNLHRLLKRFVHSTTINQSPNLSTKKSTTLNKMKAVENEKFSPIDTKPSDHNLDQNRKRTVRFDPTKMCSSLFSESNILPFTEQVLSPNDIHEENSSVPTTNRQNGLSHDKTVQKRQVRTRLSSLTPTLFEQTLSNVILNQKQRQIEEILKSGTSKSTTILSNDSVKADSTISPQDTSIKKNLSRSYSVSPGPVTRLRRLQNRSKIRPISTDKQENGTCEASISGSVSSSIAQRIESLKKSMTESRTINSDQNQSNLKMIDKQTQTAETLTTQSEPHHVHHHHLYYSRIFLTEFPWQLVLSVIGLALWFFFCLFEIFIIIF